MQLPHTLSLRSLAQPNKAKYVGSCYRGVLYRMVWYITLVLCLDIPLALSAPSCNNGHLAGMQRSVCLAVLSQH
jgi:hypothetical protein